LISWHQTRPFTETGFLLTIIFVFANRITLGKFIGTKKVSVSNLFWWLGLKASVVSLVVAFFVGCTTFGDIRKSDPVKSVFVIDSSPKKLANCASYELSDNFNSTLIEKQGTYYILVGFKGLGYPYDIGEVLFQPHDGNGTVIELRISPLFNIGAKRALNDIWGCVVKCTDKKD
jgi:hypothetical protein